MHMNAYVERVIESVRQKSTAMSPNSAQTVEEVLTSSLPL